MAYDRMESRKVSLKQHQRLKAWTTRRPCVALMGEFSAGKSTLLNFLIEENLLPTMATATELPPVWFSHGTAGSHWIDADGVSHELKASDIRKVPMTARFIRIYAEAEILEHCDIIDTPGISDPNLAVESWRFAAGQANMVLWCTSATQAWRETERGAWLSLPERLQKHSLLVVTRADKLLTAIDRDKVARRLARETGKLFGGSVFMATPDAVRAKAELAADETSELWEASGAAALLDRLAERIEAIYEERAEMLDRYEIIGEGAIRARRPSEIRAAAEEDDADQTGAIEQVAPYLLRDGDGVVPARPARPQSDKSRRSERLATDARSALLSKLRDGFLDDDALAAGQARVSNVMSAYADTTDADEDRASTGPEDTAAERPEAEAIGAPAAPDTKADDAVAEADQAGMDALEDTIPQDLAEGDEGDEADVPEGDLAAKGELAPAAGKTFADDDDDAALRAALQDEEEMSDDFTSESLTDDVEEPAELDEADEALGEGDTDEDALEEDTRAEVLRAEEVIDEPHAGEDEAGASAKTAVAEAIDIDKAGDSNLEVDASAEESAAEAPDEGDPADTEPTIEEEAIASSDEESSADAESGEGTEPALDEPVGPVADAMPRELAIWRAVVARRPQSAANAEMVAIIDEYLSELYGDASEVSETAAGASEQPTASGDDTPAQSSAPVWRRLA